MLNYVNGQKQVKKVLVLSCDTGGGHNASAQALRDALHFFFADDVEIVVLDLWTDHAHWPMSSTASFHSTLVKIPKLWRIAWRARIVTEQLIWRMASSCNAKKFRQVFLDHSPDIIVSVHPLLQYVPLTILKDPQNRSLNSIPFVTVVTDLANAHFSWFDSRVDTCFVPSNPIRWLGLLEGLKGKQIRQHGLPIRQEYWDRKSLDPRKARVSLSLDPHYPTCVVVGGGDGVGSLVTTTEEISMEYQEKVKVSGKYEKMQIITICGKNNEVFQTLFWRLKRKGMNLRVDGSNEKTKLLENDKVVHLIEGFVPDIHKYYTAADVVVTKAGPGTIAECLALGVPMIINGHLPGQEEGNTAFVVVAGAGLIARTPNDVASKTVSLLMDKTNRLNKMKARAFRCARPMASLDIAWDIGLKIGLVPPDRMFGLNCSIHNRPYRKEPDFIKTHKTDPTLSTDDWSRRKFKTKT